MLQSDEEGACAPFPAEIVVISDRITAGCDLQRLPLPESFCEIMAATALNGIITLEGHLVTPLVLAVNKKHLLLHELQCRSKGASYIS